MPLQLYNTPRREKQPFEPIDPDHVRMYVCGPTVYDRAHIGNARPVVVFDVLYRLLKRRYPKVTYVRNITDVDDKIIVAAGENGEPIDRLTARTTAQFHQDMAALGALPPDVEPKATEHIPQMIAMIGDLIAKQHAYAADGHVLFHVPSLASYGSLSGRDRDAQVAGARVEVAPYKKDPADFVLWKPSDDGQPGWESPWGRGRPGWHIECSAMSAAHLGASFDIHGGGRDLIFPHHENEVAQSIACYPEERFANYWVHNGFLTVNGEKMSKSLGNFFTVRDLLGDQPQQEMWYGEAIRLMMLRTNYRQPLDFTRDALDDCKRELDRWYRLVDGIEIDRTVVPTEVDAALDDDLNTPEAISAMRSYVDQGSEDAKGKLKIAGIWLGMLSRTTVEWFKGPEDIEVAATAKGVAGVQIRVITAKSVRVRIAEREEARKNKNFVRADEIRDDLEKDGIVLEDRPDGTTDWRRTG